jgi:hypothetical protein
MSYRATIRKNTVDYAALHPGYCGLSFHIVKFREPDLRISKGKKRGNLWGGKIKACVLVKLEATHCNLTGENHAG